MDLDVLEVHEPLRVGQPGGDRLADAEGMSLEREEPHDLRTVVDDGNTYDISEFAHRDGELWRQERIVEGGVRLLQGAPAAHFGFAQFTGVGKGDVHGLLLSAHTLWAS
ncbi:hypothetical protein GCM10009850_088930 [Nonomuraea monospora]|uniref:Uncharacterized protein n=1 Tax=Nonomuraea monospora TaxID=568818 RepID=A0ABN3CVC4_9ACTN